MQGDTVQQESGGQDSARRRVRRWLWILAGLLGLCLITAAALALRPAIHLIRTAQADAAARPTPPVGQADDASRLNATSVTTTLAVPADPAEAERQLEELLQRAAAERWKVSIAGARHSMGGHTLYPGGVAIDMLPFSSLRLDETTGILHAGAGARWSDVIPYLNDRGLSVGVMQSNNSFSIGGSLSVNCHGWQTGRPPIASTVEAFRLMLADGRIVRCSRSENRELFSLALGGYGLFGIILDVELRVVPNERYQVERVPASIESYAQTLEEMTSGPEAAMVYGRLDITPENFLGEARLNIWRRVAGTEGTSSPLAAVSLADLRRCIFRGSVGSDYGKDLRWWAECNLEQALGSAVAMRNDLLNVGVELYENRSADSTDILHEYFVPLGHFAGFVERARRIIRRHQGDLLNVTVRDVAQDDDTFLRYADQRMLCLVMLFNQKRTAEAEQAMEEMTVDLIEAALEENGRYYLCYRLHATPDQMQRAYPQADRFFELKRQYDPGELFQNEFYRKYGSRRGAAGTEEWTAAVRR